MNHAIGAFMFLVALVLALVLKDPSATFFLGVACAMPLYSVINETFK